MSPISKTEIKNIDHLGIVAGLIDEKWKEWVMKN
jgi:hypothetical protein